MFKELVITEIVECAAGWYPDTGNIIISVEHIMLKPQKYHRDRSIEEMAYIIFEKFLIEFICMEICGGNPENVDCKFLSKVVKKSSCIPLMTTVEMLRDE